MADRKFDKQAILANLRKARQYWIDSVPVTSVDLDVFQDHHGCGTVACLAGHLATSGLFADVIQLRGDLPSTPDGETVRGSQMHRFNDLFGHAFGPNLHELFASAPDDMEIMSWGAGERSAKARYRMQKEQWDIALARLDGQIAIVEAMPD